MPDALDGQVYDVNPLVVAAGRGLFALDGSECPVRIVHNATAKLDPACTATAGNVGGIPAGFGLCADGGTAYVSLINLDRRSLATVDLASGRVRARAPLAAVVQHLAVWT